VMSQSCNINPVAFDPGMFAEFMNAAEIGLMVIDETHRITMWNLWMETHSGIPSDWAQGRTLVEVFPYLKGSKIVESVAEAIASGKSAVLNSSLHKTLFPLLHESRIPGRGEPMHQIVVCKPLQSCCSPQRCCLVQVFDVTTMAHRESLLRQQARTMEALAENYRRAELQNRAIVNNTADAIITFDEDGKIGTYNLAAVTIFGHEAFDMIGQPIQLLLPGLNPETMHATSTREEVVGRHQSGRTFPLELSSSSMELGGKMVMIAIGHDITQRKLVETATRNQMEWLNTLVNALPDHVCFKDEDGRWLVANSNYLSTTGLVDVDYRGLTNRELAIKAAPFSGGPAAFEGVDDDEGIGYERLIRGPDGIENVFDVSTITLLNQDGTNRGKVIIGRNVTERKLAAQRISHLAHHDSLTGLPNRELFQDRLRQSLAQINRSKDIFALLFLDLDRFKDINDTLGHHVGDLLLQAVAKRLLRCVRETDTVARLGGDEFAIILNFLDDPADASTVAKSIVTSISEPFRVDEHEVLTSTSIGITIAPSDSSDPFQLLKNADLAMFRSKSEGRNNFHFYRAEMDAEIQAIKLTEIDLRAALGTDQLRLHFQPLVEVTTGQIVGCEVLSRWLHPIRGWVSPADFIPVAERSDLIQTIGRWVLLQSCKQAQLWADAGMTPLKIAVNLSPAQFKQRGLLETIQGILHQTGMPPEQLQLEITEGIAMQNVEETLAILRQIRGMGVLISIDDFGTGYSSLNYLKRFPVDKLKIDRSFVIDIGLHPDNEAVVKAIVDLGHSLGMRVNVEGVETAEQLDFLHKIKVDEAQGFYYSKALPADEFVALVRATNDQ
jgi:diguanylate cyclase (GGDEF)-like protein/PAS domain S-box-containing protein